MKRTDFTSGCITVIFLFIGLVIPKFAHGQFEGTPESVILDNTKYQFFSDFYQKNSTDSTTGGSSLKIISPPSGFSNPNAGVFVSGGKTVTFDYKFDKKSTIENFTFRAFSGLTQSVAGNLLDTDGLWCRVSVFIPVGVDVFQWFTEKDDLSNSLVLLDNVQIKSGNQEAATKCFSNDTSGINGGLVFSPIISLVLGDETLTPGSFSGSISLPAGVMAGVGGVTLEVETYPLEFVFEGFNLFISSVEVIIPQGQNSVNYRIDLREDPNYELKGLKFECLSGCDSLDVTTRGYWSETIGVTSFFNYTDYSHYEDNDVDITLEAADSFSGTLQFPSGLTSDGSELIVVRVREENGVLSPNYLTLIRPEIGETSWPFKVGAPSDSTAPNWSLEISCLSCNASITTDTQYATQITGNPLTTNSVSKYLFAPDQDFTGIDLEILLVSP